MRWSTASWMAVTEEPLTETSYRRGNNALISARGAKTPVVRKTRRTCRMMSMRSCVLVFGRRREGSILWTRRGMSPVPSFSTRRWERKSSSRARSWTFMTLVERHFVLEDFLCREGALDEMAIWDGFGGRGRRGKERSAEQERRRNLWRMTGHDDAVCPQRRPLHHLPPVLNNKSGSIIFTEAVQSASAQGHQT